MIALALVLGVGVGLILGWSRDRVAGAAGWIAPVLAAALIIAAGLVVEDSQALGVALLAMVVAMLGASSTLWRRGRVGHP